MAENFETPKPKAQPYLGTHKASDKTMDSQCPCLSPTSFGAFWRYYLRQEPDEVVPQGRICAGVPRKGHSYRVPILFISVLLELFP
jgi:hypothetical protein